MIFVTIHQYTDGKKARVSRHWTWGAPKRAGSHLYWLFMFVEAKNVLYNILENKKMDYCHQNIILLRHQRIILLYHYKDHFVIGFLLSRLTWLWQMSLKLLTGGIHTNTQAPRHRKTQACKQTNITRVYYIFPTRKGGKPCSRPGRYSFLRGIIDAVR